MKAVTLKEVKENNQVKVYLEKADEHMAAVGYTEHGQRHALLVAKDAYNILSLLGYPRRDAELAAISGYLHDIGCVVGRYDHGEVSALLTQKILSDINMEVVEIAKIIGAIGNHEEERGEPISPISAGLILADKSDVHRSRVRNPNMITFDIHDRVNYAAKTSSLKVNKAKKTITLALTLATKISQVMEYFEIFLSRMVMCRAAAKFLKYHFELIINEVRLL